MYEKKTMFEQLDFSKQMIPINSISANGIMRSFTELLNCKSFSKREGDYYVNNFRQKNKKCVKAPIRILQCHPILMILDNCRGAIVICNSTSHLDNAPIYLVGCVIQKRYMALMLSDQKKCPLVYL